MKHLILMRHAEAQPGHFFEEDYDRPLSLQGWQQLELLKPRIRENLSALSMVLCSSAVRTQQTLEGLREAIPVTAHTLFSDQLYNAPPSAILEHLQRVPEDQHSVMIIAHNPGVSQAVQQACMHEDVRQNMPANLPPATVALFNISAIAEGAQLHFSDLQLDSFIIA